MKLQFNLQWEGEKKHRLLWKCSKLAALITSLIVQNNLKKMMSEMSATSRTGLWQN